MKKIIKILAFGFILALLFGSVSTVFAYESYDTYTYSIDGVPMMSPTAYVADQTYRWYDMGLDKPLNSTTDIFADSDGNIYLADKGNNRVVVLNKYYSHVATIDTYVDEYGREQSLLAPQGLYVTNPDDPVGSYIYVCDTGNCRIVIFDREYNYVRTINRPDVDESLLSSEQFVPQAIAVDLYGRIFIVSSEINKGVLVLSGEGDFTGFIGQQKVKGNFIDQIWQSFMSDEERANQIKLSVPFNNITVDEYGFIYVTTHHIDAADRFAALRSKSADFSPVKKLNSTGIEIMKRNGFFDPSGEVVDSFHMEEVSTIKDVALGPEGSWTLLDYDRSRLFTYDQNGNLLFAFGDRGSQLGNGEDLAGLTYQTVEIDGEKVHYILLLDKDGSTNSFKIQIYSPTDYCDTIMNALRNQNEHNYAESIDYWQEVLTKNNNFDLAYIGIGKALYSQAKYDEAQDMLEKAYETEYASKAFSEQRKAIMGKILIPVVIVAVIVLVAIAKFLGYAKKKNKAATLKVGRKTYWEELLYPFHLVFHPFDGFWDLKHEKRGSVRAATTILAITIISFFYNSVGKGYLHNPRGTYSTIFVQILSIAVPVLLWTVANWCLTTLFDGEGGLKDIYIATCYSLSPLPVFVFISTVLTNVMTVSEGSMVSLIITVGFAWVIMLLFFGTLVTHDYSLGKNIITILGTIVAMVVIMFVAILFSSLVVKMVTFVISLVTEIAGRV